MKSLKLEIIACAGLALSPQLVGGLPQPIGYGVLTGPLNANGKAITNVAAVTFADGSSQNTAQIPGMVTNTGMNYSIGLSNSYVKNGILSWNLPFGFYVWGDSFNPVIGDGSFSLMADNVTPLATFARDQMGHFYFLVPGQIPMIGNGSGLTNLSAAALMGTAPASVITNAPGFWAATPSSGGGGNTNCVQAYASNGTNLILHVGVTNAFWILATNDIYLTAPSGLLAGQSFSLQIIQDSAGGHSLSYNPNYWKVSGGIAPTLATNAGAWNALICLAGPSGTNVAFVLTPNLR